MSAAFLREAAAEMRDDAVDEYDISSETFWTALADWMASVADSCDPPGCTCASCGPHHGRTIAQVDLDKALAVAAAYLNRPPP